MARARKRFKTVLDCCFFHVLADRSREKYERFLRRIVEPGGLVYILCSAGQIGIGPRAVSKSDIEQTFGVGWSILSFESSIMEVSFIPAGLGMPATFTYLKRNTTYP